VFCRMVAAINIHAPQVGAELVGTMEQEVAK
jgi:hypothetical protein